MVHERLRDITGDLCSTASAQAVGGRSGPAGWSTFLAILLLIATSAAAVSQTPALSFFHHQIWTTEEGLPQASVHALLQSRDGYLWVATEGGAARFDGQSFDVLNHNVSPAFVSDDVTSLTQDEEGDLWFGTLDGVIRKKGGSFQRFSRKEGLPSEDVLAIASTRMGLFVLTPDGLAVWREGSFDSVATGEPVTRLDVERGEPVLTTRTGIVLRLDNGAFTRPSREADGHSQAGVAKAIENAEWSYGASTVEFVSGSSQRSWRAGTDFLGSRIQVLYIDKGGRTWIGTNKGLFLIETPEAPVASVAALSGESVLAVLEDREGDVWVGTEASGLQALQPRKFATARGSAQEATTAVVRDSRGSMYFGTREDGLFRVADQPVPVAQGKLTSSVVLSLAAGQKDELWAGTPDGLNLISDQQVKHWTVAEGLPDDFVRSVTVSVDGVAWAGTRAGLARVTRSSVRVFTKADGLPSDSIGPILTQWSPRTRETLVWVGTSAGLSRLGSGRFTSLASDLGKGNNAVTALAADQSGTVWVALHGHGLGFVSGEHIVAVPAPALPQDLVDLLPDQSGYLWLRAAHGIYRASITALQSCANSQSSCRSLEVSRYGRNDGMPSEELAGEGAPGCAQSADGELWFATRRGIAVVDPTRLYRNTTAPEVAITRVQVDGTELPTNEQARLSPGRRQYSFEYAGVSLNGESRVRYKYMLEGFDRNWVDAGARKVGYYTNLSPGHYVFRVLAMNSDGVWSKADASYDFRVLRPWYRSLWAYGLGIFLAALLLLSASQLRVRTERRQFALVLKERTRVAREVHDTLAQDLVGVSLQVEIATQQLKAGRLGELSEHLEEARTLVRQALESARQSIWDLRANRPEDSLPVRLATRVEAFRKAHAPAQLRIGGEYRPAPPHFENEIMRIASETISNVERHAGATDMKVDLRYEERSLTLQIRDNGRGFDLPVVRGRVGHYGLQGLEERAALLHAAISIESEPGQGTTVTLIAPMLREER